MEHSALGTRGGPPGPSGAIPDERPHAALARVARRPRGRHDRRAENDPIDAQQAHADVDRLHVPAGMHHGAWMSVLICLRNAAFALKSAPSLSERQEKPLFPTQSAFHDIGLAFQRQDVSVMRHLQSRQVSDILTQDLLAIDAKIGEWAVAVKLRHHLRSRRVIPGKVISSPPITESSLIVVNISQFVKAVS